MTARLMAAGLPEPQLLIGAEDVSTGKPDPESYLKAAAALGVEPQQCIVVDKAPAGGGAGRVAGAQVLVVTTTHQADGLADVDAVVADLSCVSLEITGSDVALIT